MHDFEAILKFLLPDLFINSQIFDAVVTEQYRVLLNKSKEFLEATSLIRRMKSDAQCLLLPKLYCRIKVQMTELQRRWYRSTLLINSDENNRLNLNTLSASQLASQLYQRSRIVNHPKEIVLKRNNIRDAEHARVIESINIGDAMVPSGLELLRPEPHSPAWVAETELMSLTGDQLIKSSGKLIALDRLLSRLHAEGHRVLIYTQFSSTQTILEEFFADRFGCNGELYFSLDKNTDRIVRDKNIRSFNSSGSKAFIFLISTGIVNQAINLSTADSVIFYDISWNTQTDNFVQDRVHRIGQHKQVTIYRLFTTDSFEGLMAQAVERKKTIDNLSMNRGKRSIGHTDENIKFTIPEMIQLLTYESDNTPSPANPFNQLYATGLDKIIDKIVDDSINKCSLLDTDITLSAAEYKIEDAFVAPEQIVSFNASDADSGDLTLFGILDDKARFEMETEFDDVPLAHSDVTYKSFDVVNTTEIQKDITEDRKLSTRKGSKRHREHDDFCFLCKDGGELLECNRCPKVYHLECVSLVSVPKGVWNCPWHSCYSCGRTGRSSGIDGIMFKCLSCPLAFCFQCWPIQYEESRVQPLKSFDSYFNDMGFTVPSNCAYFRCEKCQIYFRKDDLKISSEIRPRNELKIIQTNISSAQTNSTRNLNDIAKKIEEKLVILKILHTLK